MDKYKKIFFNVFRFVACMLFALALAQAFDKNQDFFISVFSIGAWLASEEIPYFKKK